MDKRQIMLIIDALLSLIILSIVFYFSGVERVISLLTNIDWWMLLLSIIFLFGMHGAMVLRIKVLLEAAGEKIGILPIFKSHMLGMLLSDFTPARTGYLSTAANLRYNYEVPSEKAFMSILGPQILDFITKILAGGGGFFLFIYYLIKPEDGIFVIGAIGIMTLLTIGMILLLFSKRFLTLFSFLKPFPFIGKMLSVFERMQRHSHHVIKNLPKLIILLIIAWSCKAISWFFVAKALHINLPELPFPEVFAYFFIQPLLTLLEFTPSPTLAGIGLSEGGGSIAFLAFGFPPAVGVSFVLLARVKTIFINLIALPELLKLSKKISIEKILF